MGFHQLLKVKREREQLIARYRARDPWSARTTPHMLREREKEADRHTDRQTDMQAETCREGLR